MQCTETQTLIPSYLDGELSEAQAAPLRKHLLDCQPCRAGAQDGKALKRWFVEAEPLAIPSGFAARVARRAFAGDTGERFPGPVSVGPVLVGAGAVGEARAEERGRLLRFVLWTTAAAASALLFASIALQGLSRPESDILRADSTPELRLDQALNELEQLERAESDVQAEELVAPEPASEPAQGARAR